MSDQDGTELTLPLASLRLDDLPRVGGKNASLGELIAELGDAGVRVPGGFALTVDAYRRHLTENGVWDEVHEAVEALDVEDVAKLAAVAREVRRKIASAPLPPEVADAARAAYDELSLESGLEAAGVSVRSSATAEDLPSASFAGQQETYLGVSGWDELDRTIRLCMASLFTDRAIVYRSRQGIAHRDVTLSVGVQRMVRSDSACAGVMFTLDTESGFRDVVLINGSYGLGEIVVQGRVNPDEFLVHKPTLRAGARPILRRELGEKRRKLVYGNAGTGELREERVGSADRGRFVLDDDEVLELARMGLAIEDHYSKRSGQAVPMDIEWAKDGRDGLLYILQARPETVHAQSKPQFDVFRVAERGKVLARGKSVGRRVGHGRVRHVHGTGDLGSFESGSVLVAEMTDPDWEPVLARAAAVVTEQGGRTCHAAIVSREHGIPCVVATGDAMRALPEGAMVTVSCAEGDEGRVYEGQLEYARESIALDELPESPVPLMVNMADPGMAMATAQLPCAGVGLMRIEFLVTNHVGVHPMALVHPEAVTASAERAEIRRRVAGFSSPRDFFVDRLASGVGQIAAAFHPRPVTVRFSDFKTNEYAGLLGGSAFEPVESNPMIGFRGASRYTDDRYRDGFALECEAIRRVRDDMGLTNARVMIPFCRTLEEGRRVLAELDRNGLARGHGGLEVWVMCEIPNNVVLAREFSELFDGFSIGSNDLTQLTLGVDRDSESLVHLFDERDPGVKRMIEMVVESAHAAGRPVGICGQAPSDYPEFAAFLADLGIDSISLTPDSLPTVARHLATR